MKPYEAANYRPSDDDLKEMVGKGMTSQEIATQVSQSAGTTIRRQSVDQWLKTAGIPRRRAAYKSRKKYIPWQLTTEDNFHPVTRRLRDLDKLEDGDPLTDGDRRLLEEFLQSLRDADRVVAYDRVTGYRLIPRDHVVDRDDDWVRRAPDQKVPLVRKKKSSLRSVRDGVGRA